MSTRCHKSYFKWSPVTVWAELDPDQPQLVDKIYSKYAKDIPEIWPNYVRGNHQMYLRYVLDISDHCKKYWRNADIICLVYAKIILKFSWAEINMGSVSNMPDDRLSFYREPMNFVHRKFSKLKEIIKNLSQIIELCDIHCVYSIIKVK